MNQLFIISFFTFIFQLFAFHFPIRGISRSLNIRKNYFGKYYTQINDEIDESLISSKEINRLVKKIDDMKKEIESFKQANIKDEETLKALDDEYGSEIDRVKKEFSRIKERAYEEARELRLKAKVDSVKDILPITDNYFRAKGIYEPTQNDSEKGVLDIYDHIFNKLFNILEEFGAKRVKSVGEKYDYNFMEAIMTQASTEYAKDTVILEYQIGYRMEDKCIRPSIVVVSEGPGPSSN